MGETRLAYLPCCHTKGDPIRVGLKDGGERGEPGFFFFTPLWGDVLSPQTARNGQPGEMSPHQTAQNGRPGAVKVRG